MNLAFFANGSPYVMEGELLAKSVLYHMPAANLRWYFVNASQMEVRRMENAGAIPCQIPMPRFLAEFLNGYWLGMKAVACAAAAADFGEAFWFTDSDAICYGPIDNGPQGMIQAELIGEIGFLRYGSWIDDQERAEPWQEAEKYFHYAPMTMPGRKIYSGYKEGRRARLANNSGVLWIGDTTFGQRWVETLRELIDQEIFLPHKYFQEQWSFSVTLARFHYKACHPGAEHPEVVRPEICHYAGFKPSTLMDIRNYILEIGDARGAPLLETFDAVVRRPWPALVASAFRKKSRKGRQILSRIKHALLDVFQG